MLTCTKHCGGFCRISLANLLPESVFIGMVDYVDWENHWIPEGNLFYPFMHKRKSFEHEKEIRAVITDFPTTDDGSLPKTILEKGRNIEVDIQKLIKAVHISPSAPDWIKEIITQSIKEILQNPPQCLVHVSMQWHPHRP